MLRTGILLPRSTLFPSLGLDILNGLKNYLKKQNLVDEVKLITDNIGFGVNEQEVYSKAEKMLLQEDVDIVILCADTKITEMLQPLFTASNKILLAVNFGANFPDNWQPAATTITHSLNFCLHTRLTGKLAAKETNKKAVNVVSYFDGGYRQCYSMLQSHQENGGEPVFNYVTAHKAADFTLVPLADFLEQNTDVNTLLCLFAGDMAEMFYREVSPLQKKYNLNMYVSPMMMEPSLKDTLGNEFSMEHVKGFIPWHASLNNTANEIFKETISAAGHLANYFSLLGWETGMLLNEILRLNNAGNTNATSVVKLLSEISFDSPRGWMKIDAATQYSYGPSYLAVCPQDSVSKSNMSTHRAPWAGPGGEISVGDEAENIETEWTAFTNEKLPPGESSSWRNTYLCI
jgi:branched-chain amino acid transport system substrate-binding protein